MQIDEQKYCKRMEEIRHRINLVQSVGKREITTGEAFFDAELVFLQLRQTLELIAFCSLIANKHSKACNPLESEGYAFSALQIES